MELKEEALAFVSELATQYFEKRNKDILEQYLDEKISWIGTGADEISHDIQEAKLALAQEQEEYDSSFQITNLDFKPVIASTTACIVYGLVTAIPTDSSISEEHIRFSAVCEKTKEGMKLLHVHFSHADELQEEGHYFVSQIAKNNHETLQNTLTLRSLQLENLMRFIPGGIHQCANDPNLTLMSVSDGFVSMFGFSKEEIHTLFHNQFINMVYPGDRAQMLRTVNEQLQQGPDLELEYRVLCKNGQPVWILDKGRLLDDGNGKESFYCLLVEINDRKNEQEELRLTLERHQVIMDQATDIIFEWDIRKDALTFSQNWGKKFGYEAISSNISGRIPLSENIHPEDMPAFIKIMKDTAAGVPYSETEFRIRNRDENYLWCRIRATTQYDENRQPIKAVGVILDIDEEKKQKEDLLEQAQKDALTGLYNKATVNSLVEQKILGKEAQGLHALLILDVDHFKSVNDTYGHLSGDSLLSDIAATLKSNIRASDVAGRIGGDEFLVYLPEVSDEKSVCKKIETLLHAISQLTPEAGAFPISCSIGAAVFPRGSMDYLTLYKCADQALYHQKNKLRGGFSLYDPSIDDTALADISKSAVNSQITSDESTAADYKLAQYAFRTLYEARDVEAALDRLLEIIGRSYDVSRAYIFETCADDARYASVTFEWCNEGVSAQKQELQHYSYEEDLGDYQKNFDADGVFYCPNLEDINPILKEVLAPQGIHSMLQCAMLDHGKFLGGIGFDECRDNRNWTKYQVESFKLTAQVLATFLTKHRLQQSLKSAQSND